MGRNSRRKQREADLELVLIKSDDDSNQGASSEFEQEDPVQSSSSAFSTIKNLKILNSFSSALMIDSSQDQDQDQDEEEEVNQDDHDEIDQAGRDTSSKNKKQQMNKKKKKKKKDKPTTDPPPENERPGGSPHQVSPSHLKHQVIKSKLNTHRNQKPQESIDEIDRALQELAKLKSIQSPSPIDSNHRRSHQQDQSLNNLLKIDGKMLDPDLELRRMFGARVVSSALTSINPENYLHGPRISNNPHHQLNSQSKFKSTLLAKPTPTWPPFNKTSIGLSLRSLTPDELGSKKLSHLDSWFTFQHSPSFKIQQNLFLRAIMSLDPNQLLQILPRSPYHPDTLLQLSEISAQNEDQGGSLNLLNQTLFVHEKVLNGSNVNFFNHGNFRLDFRSIENRNLFKALDRKLSYLIKQGCYRTALETCKLLLSLDPYRDAYASLLWIDFLAAKSNQTQFFLHFIERLPNLQNRDPEGGIYTEAYPGLYYTRALCLRALEEKTQSSNHDPSDFALESAILRFPQVIKPLADSIGFGLPLKFKQISRAQPVYEFKEDKSHLIHLKSHIYANRSSSLWKVPERLEWLKKILDRSIDKFFDPNDPDVVLGSDFALHSHLHTHSAEGIYRAVLVSDIPTLKKFLPPSIYSHSATNFSYDPLPPDDGTHYDDEYFKEVRVQGTQPNRRTVTDRTRGAVEVEDEPEEGEDELEFLNRGGLAIEGEDGLGVVDGNEEEMLFDELELVDLDDRTIDRLIQEIQVSLQFDDDRLTIEQREFLLNRLDALLDHQDRRDRDPTDLPAPAPIHHPDDHPDDDPNDESDELRHRMPGSFVD